MRQSGLCRLVYDISTKIKTISDSIGAIQNTLLLVAKALVFCASIYRLKYHELPAQPV